MNGKNYESVFKNVGEPIDLFLIDDFPGHPYKVIDNSDMTELTESIKANGLLNPIIVRKKADGRYELISGHRRKRAYEILKLKKINAVITDLNDDEAIIMMVDSNCQRSNILPSEKAFSYKMKLDAIKRQGKRTDLTLSQVGKKLNAYEELARSSGDSRNQVHRYIRLTYLVPELLEFVDNGRMKMQPAVELSYLDEEAQRDIVDIIDETDVFPSFSQTVRMRKTDKGELTYEKISEILSEDKPNQRPTYRISAEKISQLIPREYNDRQAEEYIIKALECYRKTLNRKMKKDKIA
jgi:ParB family chromosome partitioning protein